MHLKEKVILVTGAASGLGEACAKALVEAGAYVVMLDCQIALLKEKSAAIGALSCFCDVTDTQSIVKALDFTMGHYAAIHGLVNCAGILGSGRAVGRNGPMEIEYFNHVLQINLVGAFNMIRLCAAQMMQQEATDALQSRGVIINTASIAAFEGQLGQVAYSASKAGIVGMTLPLAREFATKGIRVVSIAPGIMDTSMLESMTPSMRDDLSKKVPFPQKLGDPHSFAALVVHVFENDYLNGETIRLDAGLRLN